MQKKIQKFTFSIVFYEWKEGGQSQPPAIKYKGKKHSIISKVKEAVKSIGKLSEKSTFLIEGKGSKQIHPLMAEDTPVISEGLACTHCNFGLTRTP